MIDASLATIPAFDYLAGYEAIRGEILEAIESVLASGSLILGPRVRVFEEEFARFLCATDSGAPGSASPGSAVAVGNGTDALAIALRALGIGAGHEVITVANTAIPTVSAIRMIGATPVFAEIDPVTLLIDIDDARARITAHTRAILPVHLYGNAVDMTALMRLADEHGLAVIEDCARSCGTTWRGKMTGTFGDVGCFSFYPTKNLGAYGDGGLCFTRSSDLADAMREIRAYGCHNSYHAEREGVNSRLDELQAAILEVKLRHLPHYLARRREIARQYAEHLSANVWRPRVAEAASHSYHLFVIDSAGRDRLAARLASEGVGFGIHYPTPIHRMRGYQFLGYGEGSLPHTERAARRVLSLPCYPELHHEDVRRICSVVNDVAGTEA